MWVLLLETKVHDPQLTYQNLDYQVMLESPISKILPWVGRWNVKIFLISDVNVISLRDGGL